MSEGERYQGGGDHRWASSGSRGLHGPVSSPAAPLLAAPRLGLSEPAGPMRSVCAGGWRNWSLCYRRHWVGAWESRRAVLGG